MEKGSSIRTCSYCGKKVYYPKGKIKQNAIFGFSHEDCLKKQWENHIQRSANHHVNMVKKAAIEAMYSKHSKEFKEKKLNEWIEKENKKVV
jgi:hypothetical protein